MVSPARDLVSAEFLRRLQQDHPDDRLMYDIVDAIGLYSPEDKIYHHDVINRLILTDAQRHVTMKDVHDRLWSLSSERIGMLDFHFEMMSHDGMMSEVPTKTVAEAIRDNQFEGLGIDWAKHIYTYVTRRF